MTIKLKFIELSIKIAIFILRKAVSWRMKRGGYSKQPGTHNWTIKREKILPADPDVSVTVHEGNAIKDLVSAAVVSIFYKNSKTTP